jgi:type I restriction enzyme S subunit
MLSTSWEKYKLVDILENIESGKRPYGGADEYSGIIPSIGGENIKTNGQMDYTTIKRIPFDYFRTMTSGHLFPSDVLINKDGAQTGKVGLYRGKYPEAAVNEHVFIIRGSSAYTTQLFLYYLLLWSNVQQQINQVATGSAQPGINSKFANYIDIRLPPLPEQRRIAEILEIADEAIRATERVIAKLKQVQKGLLHDLLTRGLDENGLLRDPEAHPEQFKDSPLGRIPKEWTIRKLEDLTEKIVDGVHKTPRYIKSGIPFLTVENLTRGSGIDFRRVRYISYREHLEYIKRADPKPGDVLVTKDGTLGVAHVIPDNSPEFSIFVSVAQLRPRSDLVTPLFIKIFFETNEYEKQIGIRSAGTGLKHIHLEHFREFELAVPSKKEQIRMGNILGTQGTRIRAEETKLAKLKQVKRGLMDDLLTGKVRVSQ